MGQTGAPEGPGPPPVERERRRLQVDGVKFGARCKELRRARGWSLHDLHDLTGVAASTISDLERGKTPDPLPWVTHAIAVAFGCPSAGDMVAWLDARDRGEAYEPEGGRGLPFGPARFPGGAGPKGHGDTSVEALSRALLRALWRAQQEGDIPPGQVGSLDVLVVGTYRFLPHPTGPGGEGAPRPDLEPDAPGGIRPPNADSPPGQPAQE